MNTNHKLQCFKSAVAFFFLFFLNGISFGNGHLGISYNGTRLGEGAEHKTSLELQMFKLR